MSEQSRQDAVSRLVRELEQHVSAAGWDAGPRLFAIVSTPGALRRDPALAAQLPPEVLAAATADPEHLTAVEQEDLPPAPSIDDLLAGVAWPSTVDGAALVLERAVLPPAAEAEIDAALADLPPSLAQEEAARRLAEHPDRLDVRLAAAVLRDGTAACALRSRAHDDDSLVAVGPDLVPELVAGLQATLE